MKPPYESLSRLHSGDLPEAEASALKELLLSDPEAARTAQELEQLVSRLSSLPEQAPPRELDDQVLGRLPAMRPPSRARPRLSGGALPWVGFAGALAATAVLAWLPPPPTQIVVHSGEQIVEGRAELLAADALIELDGRARITMEPSPPSVRGPAPEGSMKVIMGSLGGAAVGAVVTVAVLQGHATVTAPDGARIELDAGERHVVDAGGGGGGLQVVQTSFTGTAEERAAALQAEVTRLEQELAAAKFEGAVARGQIAREQGEPVPWPKEVDPDFLPAAFEANLRAELAKIPGLEIHALDCEEFPCVVTLFGQGDFGEQLKQLPETLTSSYYPESGVWMGVANSTDEKGPRSAAGIAVLPPSTEKDDALRTRTDFRAGNMLRELEEQLEQ
jgi:ferric-dicitrate binding protein FerR (iron transport regulator)